jgi:hypothetical protein
LDLIELLTFVELFSSQKADYLYHQIGRGDIIREIDNINSGINLISNSSYWKSVIIRSAIRHPPSVEEDMGENWIVDNATFNYRLTCDEDQTQFIALVIHGINNKQKLTLIIVER